MYTVWITGTGTFLSRSILDWQCDELLVGRQDRSFWLCLFPLHVSVELSSLSPGAKLLDSHLFKVKAFLQVQAKFFKFCKEVSRCQMMSFTNKQTNKEKRTFQKSLLVWEAIYLWTHPCTPPLWPWPALRLLVQSQRVEPLYFGCCCQWYLLHPDLHQGDWSVAWHPGPQL